MFESTLPALQVAVLEDDLLLRERILLPRLADYGFATFGLGTAAELECLLARQVPDMVVLDVGLPDADGVALVQSLRERYPALGVVMLTGRQDSRDRVRGLLEGADAYLVKPVEVGVLAASLHSLGRRLQSLRLQQVRACQEPAVAAGAWQLDAGGWRLQAPGGSAIALTRSERPVVRRLMLQAGMVVSRDALIAQLTDNVFEFDTHRLDSLIHRLRRKVHAHTGQRLPLDAVHGQGYVFVP